MKFIHQLYISILALTLTACTAEPVPINYGQDACHFCKMNIVDRQHAAEIVTQKGKAYKYDAIECMVQDLPKWPETEVAFYLITDYDVPAKLVDATQATYLISENIPSPMGANLSGFEQKEKAIQTQELKGGKLYSWTSLKEKI